MNLSVGYLLPENKVSEITKKSLGTLKMTFGMPMIRLLRILENRNGEKTIGD